MYFHFFFFFFWALKIFPCFEVGLIRLGGDGYSKTLYLSTIFSKLFLRFYEEALGNSPPLLFSIQKPEIKETGGRFKFFGIYLPPPDEKNNLQLFFKFFFFGHERGSFFKKTHFPPPTGSLLRTKGGGPGLIYITNGFFFP